jgi:pimeloyl-ACP methyl ester carboxylesterase
MACAPRGLQGRLRTVESVDGVSIAYQVYGDGEPALVFIHGWSCDQAYWTNQVPHFSKTHKVVTLDLAGHGASGNDRENWSITAFAEDVVAVADALDLKSLVLIGHSMGGAVMLEAAWHLPGRVHGLIGVDTLHDVSEVMNETQILTALAPMRADFEAATRDMVTQMLFAADAASNLVERVSRDMASAPPTAAIPSLESLYGYNAQQMLERFPLPVRCINTDMFPTKREPALLVGADFEVVLMEGLGHFPMLEAPERFNRVLASLLAEMLSRR